MFRTRLIPGDPLRNFTILSSVDGGLNAPLRLESPDSLVDLPNDPIGASPDPDHLRIVSVPAKVPPGDYTLTCGGEAQGDLTVLAPPPPPEPVRAPDLRAFLVILETLRHKPPKGPVEVTFGPGVHRYSGVPIDLGPITPGKLPPLPPGSVLRGNGCRLVNEGTTGTLNALFTNPPDDLTVEDFEFVGPGLTFLSTVPKVGLVVHRSKFAGGYCPAWGYTGALFLECEFDRSCANGAPTGLYWRCRWRDCEQPTRQKAFALDQPTDGGWGMLDVSFENCGKAVTVYTTNGPITNCFIHGLRVSGNDGSDNGNELLSVEGPHPFDRNLVTDVVGKGNYGRAQVWNAPARKNLFLRLRLSGPGGFLLAGDGGADVSGNVLDGFEFDGGTLRFGTPPTPDGPPCNVRDNVARNGVIGPPRRSWLNQPMDRGWRQPDVGPAVYDATRTEADKPGANTVEPSVEAAADATSA